MRWTRDGQSQPGLNDVETVVAGATARDQVWAVTVVPTDGKDVGEAGQAEVVIRNTAPVTEASIRPTEPTTYDAIRVTSASTDVDGDNVSETIAWFLNGAETTVSGNMLASNLTSRGDAWEVVITARDGTDSGEPVRIDFVIANSPPTVRAASVLPAVPTKADTLTCVGDGWTDADGDPETYLTSWSVDGVWGEPATTLDGADLVRGQSIACRLVPTDGELEGEPVVSAPVVFGNSRPHVASVSIGPNGPVRSDTVSAVVSRISDPDGDDVSLRYSWRVNGTQVATTETLGGNRFVRGDEIVLQVTPNDGRDDGLAVLSDPITGGNNAPTLDLVEIRPADLFTADTAEVVVTSNDPDGDALTTTVSWTVDGVAAGAFTTLDGLSAFDKGQDVQVAVQVDDGALSSPVVASTVLTVRNSPPTTPILVGDPAEPSGGEAIVCKIGATSVDDDPGDSVSYRFSWTLNGATFTDTSTTTWTDDTANSGSWTDGDKLLCTVTPSDGDDDGEAATINLLGINPPCADTNATISEDSNGRTYVICDELETYSDAQTACGTIGTGWTLASVRSSTENSFLDGELVSAVSNGAGNPFAWIGYSDADTEGSWVWEDGDTSTYRSWGKGEPSGSTKENCAILRGGRTWSGTWNDIDCTDTQPYVCTEK